MGETIMRNRPKPALRRIIAQDGKLALDAQAFKDGSHALSYSEIYEASPQLRKMVEDEIERRAQDCHERFASKDSGATIQTSRRKATLTGYR